MSESILTKKQEKTYTKFYHRDGKIECIEATVRHDDRCGNGHNTFSITGAIYTTERYPGEATIKTPDGKTLWMRSCGRIHDDIAEHFPELAPLLKWHLCSTDGPLHYVANTVYHAGERELDAARRSAIWPDATDEELTAPGLKERLEARLPGLLAEFRAAVESLGFTY